ncbi:MAG: hypothetical protein QNL52_02590 [Synechococcus sp. ChBW.bin.23]
MATAAGGFRGGRWSLASFRVGVLLGGRQLIHFSRHRIHASQSSVFAQASWLDLVMLEAHVGQILTEHLLQHG